jgi:hypothetical protein
LSQRRQDAKKTFVKLNRKIFAPASLREKKHSLTGFRRTIFPLTPKIPWNKPAPFDVIILAGDQRE